MKPALRIIVAIAVLPALLAAAEEPTAKYSFLPDIVAQTVNHKISRSEALKMLTKRCPPDTQASPEEVKALVKRAVTEELCINVVKSMLKESGIEPSANSAQNFLTEQEKGLPAALGLTPLTELQQKALVNDELYILAIALRDYFRKTDPVKSEISDMEAEYFYRSHQLRFLKAAHAEFAFVAVPEAERAKLEQLRIQLLQNPSVNASAFAGESVDSNSKRMLVEAFLSANQEKPFAVGVPSPIIKRAGAVGFGIVRRQIAEEYIPFSEVKEPIKNYLQFRRGNLELKKLLEKNILDLKLQFYI